MATSIGNFWSVPHSQLYAEPERLEAAGYLTSEREQSGRRRKYYRLTERGRQALEDWRQTPTDDARVEMRDLSLLKLHLGADPRHPRHPHQDPGTPPRGPWLTLEAGIAHEREWIRFWANLIP